MMHGAYNIGISCIGWTLIILIWIGVVPCFLWGLYENHKRRKTMIMHKRGIHLSFLSCVACILWLSVAVPLCFLTDILDLSQYKLLLITHSIGHPTIGFGVYYVLFIRFFMLYFHHNWTAVTLASPNGWIYHVRKPSKTKAKHSTNRQLAHASQVSQGAEATAQSNANFLSLSPPNAARKSADRDDSNAGDTPSTASAHDAANMDAMKHSWFIQKRAQYGSMRRVLSKVYFGYVVSVMVVIGLGILAAFNARPNHLWLLFSEIAQLLYWLSIGGVVAFLYKKTPKTVADSFFYRQEMAKLFSVVMISVSVLCASTVASIAAIALYHDEPERELINILLWCLEIVCFSAACIAICYIETFWVKQRIRVEMTRFAVSSPDSISQTASSGDLGLVDLFYNTAPCSALPTTATLAVSLVENTNTLTSGKSQPDTQHLPDTRSPDTPQCTLPEIESVGCKNGHLDLVVTLDLHDGGVDVGADSSPDSPEDEKEAAAPALTFLDYLGEDDKHSGESGGGDTQLYAVLLNTLRMRNTFDLFLRHVASELSMECGFAFIEFTQFLCLLERDTHFMQNVHYAHDSDHHDRHERKNSKKIYAPNSFVMVRLPPSIPRTSIVHNRAYAQMQPIDRYRKVAQKLAQKYLESGAEFELCIHQNTKNFVLSFVAMHCRHIRGYKKLRGRSDLSGVSSQASSKDRPHKERSKSRSSQHSCGSFSNDELYHLFEPCRKELYSLMAHSCHRYVKHKQRENVQK